MYSLEAGGRGPCLANITGRMNITDTGDLDLDTEEEMILSTVARARSARSLKHKISKSCDAAQS